MTIRGTEIFLDTAYAVALSSLTDSLHATATKLEEELRDTRCRLVTTRAILFEIGNALSRQGYRGAAVQLLDTLELLDALEDGGVEIIPSDPLYGKALELYSNRMDKEWGLTDCLSFVVMSDRGIREALTHDKHFEQAGFVALMRAVP